MAPRVLPWEAWGEPSGSPQTPSIVPATPERRLCRRPNVLVDVEEVVRVVLGLDLRQARIVVAVRRLDPLLTLLQAHHVQRPAAGRIRVHRFPIADAPIAELVLDRGIRINADDDLREVGVTERPGGVVPADALLGAVDRIEVHAR